MAFTVLDGGTSTELGRLGHNFDDDVLWSARLLKTDPESIVTAHKNFLKAGAEIVVTTSYQASVGTFMEHLGISEEEATNLIKLSVQLAKRACQEVYSEDGGTMGRVAGSVGPYGAVLHDCSEYKGDYVDSMTTEDLMSWHRPRLNALLEAGADLLAIETVPALKEAEAIVKLLAEYPGAKAWVTFSCKNGSQTCHGELFSEAIKSVCQSPNVVAAGVNCTAPQFVSPLLESLRPLQLQKPIIVKPNSGESWGREAGWYGKESCAGLVVMLPQWVALGATWIGGCCRFFPEDIKQAKTYLKSHK